MLKLGSSNLTQAASMYAGLDIDFEPEEEEEESTVESILDSPNFTSFKIEHSVSISKLLTTYEVENWIYHESVVLEKMILVFLNASTEGLNFNNMEFFDNFHTILNYYILIANMD